MVVAMAGGSKSHAIIALNIGAELHLQLRDQDCNITGSDFSLALEESKFFVYPDAMIECSGNPLLIVEVLSPTTECFDRDYKRTLYHASPSILDYLIVSQDRMLVEHDFRLSTSHPWQTSTYSNPNAQISLPSLGANLPLASIYRLIKLSS